jgi:hypothetical protein
MDREYDVQVTKDMGVIVCKSGPGVKLPPIKAGNAYIFRGDLPGQLASFGLRAIVPFSVCEIEELGPVA